MRSFFLARREYCLPPCKSSTLGFLLYLGFGQATYSSKSAFIPHPPFNDAPSRDDMAAEWCAQSGKIGCGTSERALPSSFEALLKLKRDHQERRISDEILNAMLDKHYEDFQQCVSEWGGRNTSDSATRSARDEAKCTRDSERMLGAVCTIIRYFDLADPLLLQALYNRLADRTLITPRLSPSMLSLCMRCVVELGVIRNDAYAVLRETSLSLENTVLRKCQDLRVVVNIIYAIAVLENAQGTPYVYRDTARDLTPLFLRVEQLLRNIRFPHPKHLRKIAIAMRCSTYCRPQLVTLLHNCTMDVYNRSHKRKRIENTGRCLSTEDLHIILGAMMSLGGPTEELQKALYNSAVNQHGLILMSEKTLK